MEYKPCPFCGGVDIESLGLVGSGYGVACLDCGGSNLDPDGHEEETDGDVHWNTRPVEDAKDAEIAKLREALDRLFCAQGGTPPPYGVSGNWFVAMSMARIALGIDYDSKEG